MSVPNQTPYNIYTANGLSTVFAYEFYLISASDIQVTINGSEVSSGYTVSGVGNTRGGEVTFLTAPANGATVIFERVTPTYRLTDYQDNGDLLADTVNKDFDRLWMAIQRAFIYLGVALTRPLFGGGPFNANGYRIANLADPINNQDAVTKGYADNLYQGAISHSDNNFKRTLRVPESEVVMLPGISGRRKKILAFNDTGNPIAVLPESGSAADVLIQLASSELSGGTLVQLKEQINVQDALSPMLYSGRVVRLSVFYARGLRDDAAFAAAFAASKNEDGYNCRVIINDTPYTVEITDTVYQFRTNLETRYNLNTYSGFNCGVVGEFKFNGTAQFKFIRCYRPYVNVVIHGGTGIAGIDTTTPTNSSVAVQLDTVVVGAEIHIDIVNYPGYGLATFGTKLLSSQGVKGLYPSTVNAYLSGGAVYMAGTNGFGEFSSIWELDCTHGSVFNAIYDVVVHKYEGSDLLVNICNSIRFGYLLLGVANAKIFDSQGVYVGHHLGVAGASATVKQTEDLFVMDIVNSWVRFGQSRLFGANCGFRIGSAANVLFDSLEGYHINQAISITNNTSYTGTSNSPTVDVHVKQINVVNGNGQYAYSSKHCIHVDDKMLANLTLEDGRIQWNVNGRTSEYAYAIYGGSLSTSHIKIDNVRLLGNYDAEPVYMPNYDCIVKMHTPDTEVNVGGTRTTGSGRRLRVNWGMSTTETEYT
ncbi:phage tail fiber domain-containing protein, partial [Klebsiella pneumoniae]|uniref:phage tail fiber domain-containing protein n=1 Tax=Klebsiella pneumoniae TaxID=573 RepID=UPI000D922EE7